ncbi:MAG TPA: hypothetical protein VGL55_03260 [Steroidobacteraceae bacterium]|jgi:hypothetical protein
MSRLQRLEFQGAIHLIRIRGRAGESLFFDAAILRAALDARICGWPLELQHFQRLAWGIFRESCARLHGYVIEPDSGLFVLQTFGAPLRAIMRRVCGEYSRFVHQRHNIATGRSAFAARYESRIVAPGHLPHAVRRVQRSPQAAGLVSEYADYPFSSDRVYAGQESPQAPMDTALVRRLLARQRFTGVKGYRRFMEQPESAHVASLFNHGSPLDARIVGERGYVASVRTMAKRFRAAPSAERIIQTVAQITQTSVEQIRLHRSGAMGRALVAWYATRTGAASSLAEVGRWFSVSGATLGVAIHRYHDDSQYAHLFRRSPEALFGLDDRPT